MVKQPFHRDSFIDKKNKFKELKYLKTNSSDLVNLKKDFPNV